MVSSREAGHYREANQVKPKLSSRPKKQIKKKPENSALKLGVIYIITITSNSKLNFPSSNLFEKFHKANKA